MSKNRRGHVKSNSNQNKDATSSKGSNKSTNSKKKSKYADDGQILSVIESNGYRVVKSVPDGNCLFRSLATCITGDESDHSIYRKLAVAEISRALAKSKSINSQHEKPTVTKSTATGSKGKKTKAASKQQLQLDEDLFPSVDSSIVIPDYHFFVVEGIELYCQKMARSKVWGGHLELQSIVNIFGCMIIVLQDKYPPLTIIPDARLWKDPRFALTLLYRGACHYDAVVPSDPSTTVSPKALWSQIISSLTPSISPLVKQLSIHTSSQTYVQSIHECTWVGVDIQNLEQNDKKYGDYSAYEYDDDYDGYDGDDDDEDDEDAADDGAKAKRKLSHGEVYLEIRLDPINSFALFLHDDPQHTTNDINRTLDSDSNRGQQQEHQHDQGDHQQPEQPEQQQPEHQQSPKPDDWHLAIESLSLSIKFNQEPKKSKTREKKKPSKKSKRQEAKRMKREKGAKKTKALLKSKTQHKSKQGSSKGEDSLVQPDQTQLDQLNSATEGCVTATINDACAGSTPNDERDDDDSTNDTNDSGGDTGHDNNVDENTQNTHNSTEVDEDIPINNENDTHLHSEEPNLDGSNLTTSLMGLELSDTTHETDSQE